MRQLDVAALPLGQVLDHAQHSLESVHGQLSEFLDRRAGDLASANDTIREFSTDPNYSVPVGRRVLAFHNTNSLVANPAWDIVVQKTGYISEAGKCLVMKAVIEGRSVVIVLLDSFGKFTRLGDANRIRQWMENQAPSTDPIARLVKKTS